MPLEGKRPIILMASGVGITPFIGYLEALHYRDHASDAPDVSLFYLCQDGKSHAFAKRLRELAAQSPKLRVITIYRSPSADDRQGIDYDLSGRLNFNLIDEALASRRPLAYLCGSPRFLEAARDGLVSTGIPDFDVNSETFNSRAEVPKTLAAQTIRIVGAPESFGWTPSLGTILDAADRSSVSLPSGCRVGQCESCLMHVVSGQVAHLTPYDGPADSCLTCQAIPLSFVELKR
jgi:ferredoxin-NADP reductase